MECVCSSLQAQRKPVECMKKRGPEGAERAEAWTASKRKLIPAKRQEDMKVIIITTGDIGIK